MNACSAITSPVLHGFSWMPSVAFGLLLTISGCEVHAGGRASDPNPGSVHAIYLSENRCYDCIRLDWVATMGEREGPCFLTGPMYATRDRLGRFWVEHTGSVKVFDQDGAFLRQVGRVGEGPNEFRRAWPMFRDEKGLVHVFDVANARISLFDSEFALVEERGLPGTIGDAALLPGEDQYVVNLWLQTAERIGAPLHIIASEGELIKSFGASEGSDPIDGNSAGRLVATDSRDNPYPNTVMGIRVDSSDRLWVLSWIRRSDWMDSMEEVRRADGRLVLRRRPGKDLTSVFSSRIDVVDLQTGAIVARREQEELLVKFLEDDMVWAPEWEGDGTPIVSAWRLAFVPNGSSGGG